MKKSVLTLAVSILMAAALLLGAPAALAAGSEEPAGPAADAGGSFDPSRPNSLAVGLEPEDYAEDLTAQEPADPAAPGETEPDPDAKADELAAPLAVDLYQVAAAEKIPGIDGYTYSLITPSFASLEETFSAEIEGLTQTAGEQKDSASAWLKIAQAAAQIVFPAGADGAVSQAVTADKTVEGLNKLNGLAAGLYLIVPHGKDLTPAQYVEYVAGEGPEAAESVVTKAFSELYAYSFTPYLVSLPGRNVEDATGGTTGGSTADGNGWRYDVTTYLKVTREPRYGRLDIIKGVDAYADGEPATFVFRVTGTDGVDEAGQPKVVYSNVVSVTFNGEAGEKTVTLDNIPAGAAVTVEEIYSGASYSVSGSDLAEGLTISAAGTAEASFSNTHNNRNGGGYGANNHFAFNDGGWDWENDLPAQAEG